jgi:DNA primase
MTLSHQIERIDLAALVRSEGIEVIKRGNKRLACCPIHNEKTASFCIFPDGHAKCFGCGWYGDAVDLVQILYGLTFKGALQHLGINQEPLSADMRRRVRQAELKKQQKRANEELRRQLLYTLAVEIRKARKILANIKNEQQMESAAGLFHRLPYWQHCHDVLIHGENQDFQAVMDALEGLKLIKRGPLFNPYFDYRQWLRDFTNERTINAI